MKRFQYIFKSTLLVFLLSLTHSIKAAQASPDIYGDSMKISLLTCGPGHEVYSLYGHTAIRFQDLRNHQDLIINYGIFSFKQKKFILRFIFGLTDYEMGIIPYQLFYEEYRSEGRWVKEQILNLSSEDKQNIAIAIDKNYIPENRIYRYNYFYDNCTTRARDILINNINGFVDYHYNQQLITTYRNEVHQWNTQHPWARWGNDLLLGLQADKLISNEERQFIPDSLSKDFQHATVSYAHGRIKKLVSNSLYIIPPVQTKDIDNSFSSYLSPNIVMICIIVIIITSFLLQKKCKLYYLLTHYLLWTVTGFCGIILTAMIFSQHPTVSFNLQIFILNPFNLLLLFPKFQNNRNFQYVMITCYALGCVGSFLQTYADGIQLLAFVLLITNLFSLKFSWKNGTNY